MQYHPYIINCVTNLHAGSNGESHSIIDKTVQRDTATHFPTIFSSSMKGALRDHFESLYGEDAPIIGHVFGAKPKREEGQEAQGKYRFFGAQLLCLPVRSDQRPFYRVTCPAIISDLINSASYFKLEITTVNALKELRKSINNEGENAVVFGENSAILEDYLAQPVTNPTWLDEVLAVFGENLALLSDKAFVAIARKMPVIARNQLENGISNNLWYEEVVPRQTRFYTMIGVPENDSYWDVKDDAPTIKKNLSLIQIGGNATIGYGQSKFSTLS